MDYLEMMKRYDEPDLVLSIQKNKGLVQFFESDFWTNLISREIKSLKHQGQWDDNNMELNYRDLQGKISNLLTEFGLPDLGALEDGFSADEELDFLKKLKSYLINN